MFILADSIFIAETESMGRGVFTRKFIPEGTVIEISPVVVMDAEQRILLDKTRLHDYIFVWGLQQNQCCMALGYVPIYNHAFSSNCEYEMDYDSETIKIFAVRNIEANEQLFINYNGEWDNNKELWFSAV